MLYLSVFQDNNRTVHLIFLSALRIAKDVEIKLFLALFGLCFFV